MTRRRVGIGGAASMVVVLGLASCGFAGTWAADSITDHSARLNGNIGNTEIGQTRFHFEYGTTDAYGTSTPESTVTVTDVHVPVPVSSNDALEGLAEGTTYHYRLCAFDVAGGGGGCSPDATFTTTSGHDYVLGSGGVQTYGFGGHYANVDATAANDGSSPTGHVGAVFASPVSTQPEFTGDVTCLRVEGNRATVGVPLFAAGYGIGPVPSYLFIEDGIAPGAPDRYAIRTADGADPLTTCPAPTEADFQPYVVYAFGMEFPFGPEVSGGSFVVHDHP